MGTKIHTNPFLREYHPVIDLDASASNAMRSSSYNENGLLLNVGNLNSISCHYDIEKVRQTILEHESIFRSQLRELHRLYGRQRELMNEIKGRGMEEEKFQLGYLLSPFPTENTERSWNASCNNVSHDGTYNLGFQPDLNPKFPIVESTYEKRNCDGDNRFSLPVIRTPQHGADALTLNLCNTSSSRGDTSITNPTKGVPISANPWPNLNLVTKDFFHNSLDTTNKESSLSIWGPTNERSGNKHLYDEYAEKRRIDKHSSLGDLVLGKSAVFPQSLLAEQRKEFPNSPLDIGTSLSRKKKIFGVEISEENDDAFGPLSNLSSNLDRRARLYEQNHRVPTSLLADSFVQGLSLLHVENQNHCKNERSKRDSEKDFRKMFNANMAAEEVMEKVPEHSQKWRDMLPQHHRLEDCERSDQEISRGSSLPWFLKDSQLSSDLKNGAKSSYFMNLDSLQSCSQKFFAKVEKPHGTLHDSKQKKEVKGEINEVNCSVIGDDLALRVEINKGLNLRRCIDLNFHSDEEDAPSTPSLLSAVVKIATTEIDLEAPAVGESDVDTLDSRKSDMSPSYEECDKFAAEAMISISSNVKEKLDDDCFTSLKWFAEVISSQRESFPTDIDDFELMTLKLEDTREEHHHHYEPFVLKAPSDDDTFTRRNSRGQSRRGRQRRDFQRDILPSLVTLSRHQVTEDFQTFEELLKAEGPMRLRRGRKRLGGASTSPAVKTFCSIEAGQPVCQIEEKSLTGWGKKTRRLPRQRCPNTLVSFPVKC